MSSSSYLVFELLSCFGRSNSITALAAAASARKIQQSGNQRKLWLGLFCRYVAFEIIFRGNRSYVIKGQILGKLAMCQMTSRNLARCQVTWWELGKVPSHLTYVGSLPEKSRDMGQSTCLPLTNIKVSLPHIFRSNYIRYCLLGVSSL